jgi:DNA-binding HxlR family transcriptional regulator
MDTIPDLRQFGGGDAYLRTCPSRTVLDVLANKWMTLIVPALRGGPVRFGELRRRLDGITQKSLTQACATSNATAWWSAPCTPPSRPGSSTA